MQKTCVSSLGWEDHLEKVKVLVAESCLTLCVTPWTVARQSPLSVEFSRQECWSGSEEMQEWREAWVLLQGIFLTQGSNLGLLRCRQILYCLSHQGSPLPWRRKWQPTLVFLPGKIPWAEEPDGLYIYSPWGWKRVRHDLVTKQQQQQYVLMSNAEGFPLLVLLTEKNYS